MNRTIRGWEVVEERTAERKKVGWSVVFKEERKRITGTKGEGGRQTVGKESE